MSSAAKFRQTHIKLDMRREPSGTKVAADYPYLLFRRITSSENNQVNYARERIEIEIIGLRSDATVGDSLLEQIREALIDAFGGKQKTWGQYDADGTPNASAGLKLKGIYLNTVEGFSQELDEKVHILQFLFTYIRS